MSDIVKFAWKSSTNKEAKFICVGECKTHGLLLSEGVTDTFKCHLTSQAEMWIQVSALPQAGHYYQLMRRWTMKVHSKRYAST